jgi:hypothetical protein
LKRGSRIILTAAIPKFLSNASEGLTKLTGSHFAVLMYIVIVLGVLGVNVLNLYGAFMSTTTTLEAFTKLKGTSKKVRINHNNHPYYLVEGKLFNKNNFTITLVEVPLF